ncbi:ribosome silencing factor [Eudoraea sp.]|uniref:ribosome silencing factor n=1 Tax=Eudoraea sp. TaxID=1979955 RepID=UPI003C75F3D3
MQKGKASADELITSILDGIEEVKGLEINVLDLREIENTVCDYFIICNGTSNTHVNAIVNSIQKMVSKTTKDKPWHIEGSENAEWVLLDYVNIVVHVFQKHIREFYDVEGLWGDAKVTPVVQSFNQ